MTINQAVVRNSESDLSCYENNQQEVSPVATLPVCLGAGIASRPYSLLSGMRLAAALRVPDAGPESSVGRCSDTHYGSPGSHALLQSHARLVAPYRDRRCGGRRESHPHGFVGVLPHRALWVGTEGFSAVRLCVGGADHLYALDRGTRSLPHAGGNGAGGRGLETSAPSGRGACRPDDHSRNPASGDRLPGDRLCR